MKNNFYWPRCEVHESLQGVVKHRSGAYQVQSTSTNRLVPNLCCLAFTLITVMIRHTWTSKVEMLTASWKEMITLKKDPVNKLIPLGKSKSETIRISHQVSIIQFNNDQHRAVVKLKSSLYQRIWTRFLWIISLLQAIGSTIWTIGKHKKHNRGSEVFRDTPSIMMKKVVKVNHSFLLTRRSSNCCLTRKEMRNCHFEKESNRTIGVVVPWLAQIRESNLVTERPGQMDKTR